MTCDLTDKIFTDETAARKHFEALRWPDGPVCPHCGVVGEATELKGESTRPGLYKCRACQKPFTATMGTLYERSHIPLHKWLYAMYLLVTARKGISSLQLSKEIGITQKSAWFMLHRLREACGPGMEKLRGIIEIDETYVGGVERNKHETKKLKAGRGAVGKTAVLAMRERGGRTVAMPAENVDMATVKKAIFDRVEIGSTIHTDEAAVYQGLDGLFFTHDTVNHSEGEFVRGNVTTNGVESVFAVFKRGLIGVYHHVSPDHLGRYTNEFAFRLSEGNVRQHTLDRLESLTLGTAGKRLTYKDLIQ